VQGMTTPNGALRAVRMGMLLSQDDLARALRDAGERLGHPNEASKRLVQRWEAGVSTAPRPVYARALEAVTGLPVASLGFQMPVPPSQDGPESAPGELPTSATSLAARGNLSGIWLSRYEYPSSSRGGTFTGQHYVLVLQHGDRLTVRSLPDSAVGDLTMDLTVDGSVITGTWVETTAPDGYYRGARYHGSIQMMTEPTGRRMAGKWLGFGRDMDINTGPWELVFQDASTNKSTLDKYNVRPDTHER
jgi:hypothetical protein